VKEIEMRGVLTVPQLDDLEWSAVAYALDDAYGSGRPRASSKDGAGLFRRIESMLFGRREVTAISDPRNDAVRRFVWASRLRSPEAERFMPALSDLGFSLAQIDALALLSH
jgi:hypothetical protein